MRVWVVMGWDEIPRAIFSTEKAAVEFSKSQRGYAYRQVQPDQRELSRHYPFVIEYVVDVVVHDDPEPES